MSIPTLRSLDLPAAKNAGFQRVSFKTLWASVGGEPTVLNLTLKSLKAGQGCRP